MEKAIGYARVSSDEQAKEGVSLDAQEARIKAYATMRGLDLVAIYREEGVSAKVLLGKRPEGSNLVAALAQQKAKHVVAVKLDRLFRNTADALATTAAWDKARYALHVLDMGGAALDTTSAVGRMFLTMIAGFAEMERNLTSERTKAALGHKKSNREAYCHLTPLGFDRDGGRLVENQPEMQTVWRIHNLRSEGFSLQRIAAVLEQDGVPTKRGGRWHSVTIQNVLRVHAERPLKQ